MLYFDLISQLKSYQINFPQEYPLVALEKNRLNDCFWNKFPYFNNML